MARTKKKQGKTVEPDRREERRRRFSEERNKLVVEARAKRKTMVDLLLSTGLLTERDLQEYENRESYKLLAEIETPRVFRRCLARSPRVRRIVKTYLPTLWEEHRPSARELADGREWWRKNVSADTKATARRLARKAA